MKNVFLCLFFVFCLCIISCNRKRCGEGVYEKGECLCNPGWLLDSAGKCNAPDPCYTKDCVQGTCTSPSGDCYCNYFYEKDANGICTVEARSKFVGTWRGSHIYVPGGSSPVYDFTITAPDFDVSKIKISNLFDLTCNGGRLEVYANLVGLTGNTTSGGSSLCLQMSITTLNIQFLDPNTLKVDGKVSGGPVTNLEGIYSRQ